MITIEKNIPLTCTPKNKGMAAAMKSMEIGDSFLWPKGSSSVNNFHSYALRFQMKVSIRKQPCGGFRVWRVS